MADDRRTAGVYIEDENIEWKVLARVRELGHDRARERDELQPQGAAHGRGAERRGQEEDRGSRSPAGAERARGRERAARSAAPRRSLARGSDGLVTSNVKARLVNNGKVSTNT
jgi:hypothetical protein